MSKARGQSSARSDRRKHLHKNRDINNGDTYKMRVINWGRGKIVKYTPRFQYEVDKKGRLIKIVHWDEAVNI